MAKRLRVAWLFVRVVSWPTSSLMIFGVAWPFPTVVVLGLGPVSGVVMKSGASGAF